MCWQPSSKEHATCLYARASLLCNNQAGIAAGAQSIIRAQGLKQGDFVARQVLVRLLSPLHRPSVSRPSVLRRVRAPALDSDAPRQQRAAGSHLLAALLAQLWPCSCCAALLLPLLPAMEMGTALLGASSPSSSKLEGHSAAPQGLQRHCALPGLAAMEPGLRTSTDPTLPAVLQGAYKRSSSGAAAGTTGGCLHLRLRRCVTRTCSGPSHCDSSQRCSSERADALLVRLAPCRPLQRALSAVPMGPL